MDHPDALRLHHELLLLALTDRKGTIAGGASMYGFAIGGALLAELLLGQHVRVVRRGKKELLEPAPGTRPTGDPLLDECLNRVRTAKRRGTAATWVSRFGHIKQLKHRVARDLCRRGVLRADEDKILGLFRRKTYPELDPKPERELIERLRAVVFGPARDADPRTLVLAALAHTSGLLNVVFDKGDLKRRKEHLQSLVNGELTGVAAKEAIEAFRATMMVATTVPVFIAVTGSN